MKIKLTANSNITLPDNLKNVDVSYGFAFYERSGLSLESIKSDKESFSVKLFSKLETLFKTKLNDKEQEGIQKIASSIAYLNEVSTPQSLSEFKIQLNTSSELNQKYQRFFERANINPGRRLGVNDHTAHIYSHKKLMVIGSQSFFSFFNNNDENKKPEDPSNKAAEFILFHEFGHSLEYTNAAQYGTIIRNDNNNSTDLNNPLVKLLDKIDAMKFGSTLYEFNKNVIENFGNSGHHIYQQVHPTLLELSVLKSEMYADVSAILNMRNYELSQGTYSKEKFQEFVDQIINVREKEYLHHHTYVESVQKDKDTLSSEAKGRLEYMNTLSVINHFTAASLNGLKEQLNSYDDKILSEKEIHEITEKKLLEGMAKTLYTILSAHNELVPQINSLISLEIKRDEEFNMTIHANTEVNHYLELNKELQKLCGKEWMKEFDAKVNEAYSLKPSNMSKLIFKIGTMPERAEKDITSEKELNELFGIITTPTNTTPHLPIAPSNEMSQSTINLNKDTIKQKMLSLRSKTKNETLGMSRPTI